MTTHPPLSALQIIKERIESRRVEILNLTQRLVECESPSGDAAGSRGVVDILLEEANNIASLQSAERITVPDYGEHLRLTFFNADANSSSRTLILGHTDTVHPRGSLALRPWRREGEKIYGPGIFDMKANCALALEAIRACAELELIKNQQVVVLLTCDEETGSASGRALVEEESQRASRVLVLEPSAPGGLAKTGRKGTGMWTLRTLGRAAHAGLEPEKGASAILEISRQIDRLDRLNDLSRGTTINVGVVRGGTTSNVVAAEAFAEIDVRYQIAEEAHRIEEALHHLEPFDKRIRLEINGGINRPPLERTGAVIELFQAAQKIAASLDYRLGETQVGGASDANFAAAFCPAVLDGLGIEGDGAHAAHEHINITHLATRGAILAGLLPL